MAESTTETSQALTDLAALGSALAATAGKAKEQEKVKDLILEKFATISEDAAKAILKDERIQRLLEIISDEKAQSEDDPPGTIRPGWIGNAQVQGFTKKDWTESDLRNQPQGAGKPVTFIPHETLPVFWNGLMRQFIADEEITVEKCFYDIYMEHRRMIRHGKEHAEFLFRKRNTLSDPSIVSSEGARARGTGEIGWYVPGGGSVITAVAPEVPAEEGAAAPVGEAAQ